MTPFGKSILTLTFGLVVTGVPFLLGRWSTGLRYCAPCERRQKATAARARHNGEHVARLKQRATSPDDVRAQADADRHERALLLQTGRISPTVALRTAPNGRAR
jgi:hypothetical protein